MIELEEKRLYTALGANIKSFRSQSKMSQDDLAALLGLLRTSITNFESGRQKPTIANLYRLCAALQVSLSDLLPPLEDYVNRDPFAPINKDALPELTNKALNNAKRLIDEN